MLGQFGMVMFVLEALELALLGIGGNFDTLARARRESSYSCIVGGVVEKISCQSSLRSD